MKIYHYDKTTAEYLGDGSANPDPLDENNWLIPANATKLAPPDVGRNHVPVFKGGEWIEEEDHRGQSYFDADGAEVVIDVIGPVPTGLSSSPPPRDLETVRTEALIQIDDAAEMERKKYITPGEGQAMVYQQKVSEAEKYKAASSPVDTDYPIMNAEATATNSSVSSVADLVLSTRDAWLSIAAEIEASRLGAKKAINGATSVDQIDDCVAAVTWPAPV